MTGTDDHRIHATCVSIGERAVLLTGPSGAGKSDLALRLIDRGASLVSDDYTCLAAEQGRLLASPPGTIAGCIEIRHIGIVRMPYVSHVPVALEVRLGDRPERMPDGPHMISYCGVALPSVALAGLEPSAPIKVEQALRLFGLADGPA